MTENALPMAHTWCFNQLVLPSYSTVELLLKRLKLACRHGIAEGFHLRRELFLRVSWDVYGFEGCICVCVRVCKN